MSSDYKPCIITLEQLDRDVEAARLMVERGQCTHQTVVYRPVGGVAEGWLPRWVCAHCSKEFAPVGQPATKQFCRTERGI